MTIGKNLVEKEVEEYLHLLDRLQFYDENFSDYRNRKHRRFVFDVPNRAVETQIGDQPCDLHDVSIGGLSIFTSEEHHIGKHLDIRFNGKFVVQVQIVSTLVDSENARNRNRPYRHGARFINTSDGYTCTSTVLRHYLESFQDSG